jgi:tRNA threonylcarbamoyladenosine biosynthesis protein TsaB
MIAIALDTSGPVGSVAVVRETHDGTRRVLADVAIDDGMRHGVALFPALESALRTAGVPARDVGLVAVGTGPGSYTGLRVGVTAARALAYAAGARLVGVPSCDAWAAATPRGPARLAVVLDTKTGAVYLALYREDEHAESGWIREHGPAVLSPEEAAARIPADALVLGDVDSFGTAPQPRAAPATEVALLALARHASGERTRIDQVVPLYLRKSEAERRWEERGLSKYPDRPLGEGA